MSSKRIGIILLLAFAVLTIVDLAAVEGLATVEAQVIYEILTNNLAITAISGIIVFLVIVIYKKIKK